MTTKTPMTLAAAALAVAFLASMGAPAAAQQATTNAEETTSLITFYGHLFNIGRGAPMPMNTQFPYGEADLSQGFVAHSCGLPVPETEDTPSCESDTQNEEWFYTTAGFVQIKNNAEFDYNKLHNERGLTKDTYLDTTKPITATFWMSADAHGFPVAASQPPIPRDIPWPIPGWNWDPGYLSQWQIEATVYTGVLGEHGGAATEAPDIATAFADGDLSVLATGVSDPIDVQSLEPAGQPTVWRFDVDLGPAQRPVIKKEESYVIRFQWWSVKPDGSRAVFPQADVWNVNSGERYPPSVTLPVKGAFNVEMVLPQFVYDKLVILGIMNTPWGSYDVDHDSIKLAITDASGRAVEPKSIARLADFSVAHDGHYKPVNVTYVWDHKADALAPGTYKATISASNFQGSASASCTAEFTVLEAGAPGPVKLGECGTRTISDQQLDRVTTGSAQDAQNGGRERAPVPAVLVQSSAAAPVAAAPHAALSLVAAALALALVAGARRWRS